MSDETETSSWSTRSKPAVSTLDEISTVKERPESNRVGLRRIARK